MDESDSSDEEGVGTQATGDDFVALFPYQNLFKDKAEKAQIMNLNEVERESILAERQDQVQKQQDRLLVRRMATQLEGSAAGASASASSQQEASLLRGKSERKKTTTGKSDSKSSKLDELKRKRESKKRREAGAYDSDDQDARPSNMYSDEDDHDQSEDERATSSKKLAARRGKKDMHEHFVDEIGLRPLFLPRGACMSNWSKPWFATVAKGLSSAQHNRALSQCSILQWYRCLCPRAGGPRSRESP